MTEQEAYNKIRAWFTRPTAKFGYNQNEGDEREGMCVYRGNGKAGSRTRCAVGCVLPNELYSPDMEGMAFGLEPRSPALRRGVSFEAKFPEAASYIGEAGLFLSMAQEIHDDAANSERSLESFIASFDEFAVERGLEVPNVSV